MNSTSAPAIPGPARVLVVDDEPAHVEAIRRAFREADPRIEVVVARTLAEGRGLAASRLPDIMLVDLNLPDGRAIDLLDAAGAAPVGPPLLVMTSYGSEQTAVEALRAGAVDYVVKSPEAFAQMPRIVARALREARLVEARQHAESRLRERERELAAIYENAPITMMLLDADRRIVKVNHAALRGSADAAPALVGLRAGAALHCLNALEDPRGCGHGPHCGACELRAIVLDTLGGGPGCHHVEICLPLGDHGREVRANLLASTTRLDIQGRSLVLVSLLDISERRRAEQAVVEANARLEQRVAERTVQLESAVGELEAFTYSVSHDLRAPLRAIEGFAAILAEDYQERLDGEGHRLIDVVRSNARRMDALICDLLDFSRLTRREVHPQWNDMGLVAREVFGELATPLDRKEIAFSVAELPLAWADPGLVRRVWANLITNALKYTRASPVRRVTIEGTREGARAVYRISDSGVGFDQAYAGKLFGPFERLHPPEQFDGAGIGLAIVKRIVERHGGQVSAEGRTGGGATFAFSLPAARTDQAAPDTLRVS
jgi:signal transduction histidine kinase/DNA-binding response OmpR family regulator